MPCSLQPPTRPLIYKSYSREQLLKALEGMHSGPADGRNPSFGMTEAAKGIPRSTLSDHQQHKMSGNSRRYLTHYEEDQLANFMLQLGEIG